MSLQNIVIIAFVVLCVFLAFALLRSQPVVTPSGQEIPAPPAPPVTAVTPIPEGEPETPPRQSIAEESVDKLYLGLSYEQVEELFGVPSDDQESEYDRGIDGYTSPHTIVWHTWANPNNTRVRLGFINGKLEKKQFYRRDGEIITNEVKLEYLQ